MEGAAVLQNIITQNHRAFTYLSICVTIFFSINSLHLPDAQAVQTLQIEELIVSFEKQCALMY